MDTRGKFYDNYEDMYNNAVNGGVAYLKTYPNVKTLLIGLSGGIDSGLTAALAAAAADKIGINLFGYSLPLLSNKQDEIIRARDAGSVICHSFAENDKADELMSLVKTLDNSLFYEMAEGPSIEAKIRAGNIKARFRMMYLYDKAQKYNGLVLSTDNLTEYLLGFWTLHGDVGDFGFIQNLWKTEVYGLAEWMASNGIYDEVLSECLEATPTDGLGVSNNDLDQLLPGWEGSYREGYRKVDEILQGWITMEEGMDETHPVITRLLRTGFKRNNPANLSREELIG